MNKAKVAVQTLREYLGRDARGVELLEQLAEIVNGQRKRIAALERSASETDASNSRLQKEAATARQEADASKAELHREAARRDSAESRAKALQAQLAALAEPELEPIDAKRSPVWMLMRSVMKRFKKLPVQRYGTAGGGVMTEDFIKSFSYDEFAGLGMALAAQAFFTGKAVLQVYKTHRQRVDEGTEKVLEEEEWGPFIRWLRDAFGRDKLGDDIMARSGMLNTGELGRDATQWKEK